MNKGYVNFPLKDFTMIDSAKTIINLVVFDSLASTTGIDVEDYNTHLFLTGTFINDDIKSSARLVDNDISIDDLISEQLRDDDYAKLYFPQHDQEGVDIMKYLSTPLLSSTVLGISNNVFERDNGTFWRCTIDDLDDNGKRLFALMCNLYPGKDVRILTFIDEVI